MQLFFVYLRYGFRLALRQPSLTLSIITLLALGMGGMTAIFNPIYSTLLFTASLSATGAIGTNRRQSSVV